MQAKLDWNLIPEVGPGGTGDPPVPSGHWPDGRGRTLALETDAWKSSWVFPVPGGGSPPGTGQWLVPPNGMAAAASGCGLHLRFRARARGAGFRTCRVAGFPTRVAGKFSDALTRFHGLPIWKSAIRQTWKSALLLALTVPAFAQNAPRIGYVFPAGGRAGTTFQVTVGGQFLEPATNIVFTGEGIHATVVEFHKPMNQGVFNNLRDKLRELQDKKQAHARAARQGSPPAPGATNCFTAADEKELAEIRAKILKNPPNRNATPAIAEVATLRVTIDADAAPGDREIRLGAPGALSNPLRFRVGRLPEFAKAPAQAENPEADRLRRQFGLPASAPPPKETRVTPPTVINGQILPGLVDRYRFFARRGQQFVIAASARELIPYLADAVPGWFQAALTLYDAKGKEVAYNDDFRFRPDPVLRCDIPADGEYVLEVKDAIYRGREDFVYRITLGEVPFVTGIYPPGGQAGQTTEVEVAGWNLPVDKMTFDARELAPGIHMLAVTDGTNLLGAVPFAVDDLPAAAEQEPNDSPRAAQAVQLPLILNGRIGQPGDADVFRFSGRAGESIVAEVLARRLDSPLDGVLQLTDAAGKQIAFNDDTEDKASGLNTHHADPRLAATLPADGDYFLRLGDTQGKGGPELAYRLRISAPRPDFALRLVPSAINLRAGASAPVTVHALRRDGFTNEITLALKDAPPGFTLSGGKIQPGQDQVKATLTAPAVPGDERFQLELEGRANVGGQLLVRPVVPADDLMQAFFYRHLVPAQALQVSVADRFGQRGVMKILSPTPLRLPVGGTARLRVAFPRGPFMDRLEFALAEPPAGISVREVALTRAGADIVLQCDAAMTPPDLAGNLILTASVSRPNAPAPARGTTRRVVGALPAVPFVCATETAPDSAR